MKNLSLLAASLALLSGACDQLPTAPADTADAPRFGFLNGPADLPNVMRFETNNANFAIADDEARLIAIVGRDPGPFCEFLPTDLMAVQEVGQLHGTFNVLVKGKDVTLTVFTWDRSDPCASQLLAIGSGAALSVINDRDPPAPPRTRGFRATGIVEDLADGTQLRLTAMARLRGSDRLVSKVELRSIGK